MAADDRLGGKPYDHAPRTALTPEVLRALDCAAHGLTAAMTAEVLGKGYETIKTQLERARLELGAKNTAHAVAIAFRLGLLK